MKLCGRVLKRPYLRRWSSIKGFLTRWVTSGGRMVAKRALEQRYLLEATSTSYLTSLLMHHHVLSEPPLHAGQHFDEVLLRQTTSFWNLHDCISTLGTLTSKMSHCLKYLFGNFWGWHRTLFIASAAPLSPHSLHQMLCYFMHKSSPPTYSTLRESIFSARVSPLPGNRGERHLSKSLSLGALILAPAKD